NLASEFHMDPSAARAFNAACRGREEKIPFLSPDVDLGGRMPPNYTALVGPRQYDWADAVAGRVAPTPGHGPGEDGRLPGPFIQGSPVSGTIFSWAGVTC